MEEISSKDAKTTKNETEILGMKETIKLKITRETITNKMN